ncbi:Alpha-D-glucose-1-phosphate phosphatase YihX [Corynebacterium occultum]|uniref:Alpha-D-glucose-1-phosphate phosphatase YihX n=1 Tax=Corynebacterium occultum TaxID=2675219 RepID=A0A6B8WHZ6_9CORY|nr:HAD-IA family hydrolase [Corynebacterium occultum]QGU06128.1 Alpha-D-glucose-1-phosphate phosphatase YihX [Corynebacterium occultum]
MTSLLFDLYGVLMRTQSEEAKQRIERAVLGEASIWPDYWALRPAYDAGLVSDQNYWHQLRLRAGLGDFDLYEAVAADEESWLHADTRVVDEVLSLIGSGWRAGVLANIPAGLAERVREKYSWLEEFNAVTFSSDIGLVKPDEKAFHVALDAMGAKAADTIFFDDHPDNVEAAEKLGMRGVLFRDVSQIHAVLEGVKAR